MSKYGIIKKNVEDSLIEFSEITNHKGMVGWVRTDDNMPEYIYGEITGYFLSCCADIARNYPEKKSKFIDIMKSQIEWLKDISQKGFVTRFMLNGKQDWRNSAVFAFDIAMIIRGLNDAAKFIDVDDVLKLYKSIFDNFMDGNTDSILPYTSACDIDMPDKWSTRFDIHYMKIIANVLEVYRDSNLFEILVKSEAELQNMADSFFNESDTHPLMYYMEGVILISGKGMWEEEKNSYSLTKVKNLFKYIIKKNKGKMIQNNMATGMYVRSDVLSQFVRIGTVLKLKGVLDEEECSYIESIIDYLIERFLVNGKICFYEKTRTDNFYNVWCTMFFYQAIEFWELSCSLKEIKDSGNIDIGSRIY